MEGEEFDRKFKIEGPPRHEDILLGRGHGVVRRPGNVMFREIIWHWRDEYKNSVRNSKQKIAELVLHAVHRLCPSARFVEKGPDAYYQVTRDRCLKKIIQALREKKCSAPKDYQKTKKLLSELTKNNKGSSYQPNYYSQSGKNSAFNNASIPNLEVKSSSIKLEQASGSDGNKPLAPKPVAPSKSNDCKKARAALKPSKTQTTVKKTKKAAIICSDTVPAATSTRRSSHRNVTPNLVKGQKGVFTPPVSAVLGLPSPAVIHHAPSMSVLSTAKKLPSRPVSAFSQSMQQKCSFASLGKPTPLAPLNIVVDTQYQQPQIQLGSLIPRALFQSSFDCAQGNKQSPNALNTVPMIHDALRALHSDIAGITALNSSASNSSGTIPISTFDGISHLPDVSDVLSVTQHSLADLPSQEAITVAVSQNSMASIQGPNTGFEVTVKPEGKHGTLNENCSSFLTSDVSVLDAVEMGMLSETTLHSDANYNPKTQDTEGQAKFSTKTVESHNAGNKDELCARSFSSFLCEVMNADPSLKTDKEHVKESSVEMTSFISNDQDDEKGDVPKPPVLSYQNSLLFEDDISTILDNVDYDFFEHWEGLNA